MGRLKGEAQKQRKKEKEGENGLSLQCLGH